MSSFLEVYLPAVPRPYVLLLSATGAILCHQVVALYNSRRKLGSLPGRTFFFHPFSSILSNFVLPRIRGFSAGQNCLLVNKYSEYEELGYSAYRMSIVLPTSVQTLLILADADAIREVMSSRTVFPKPMELYGTLSFFGRNIVASEGDEWKKYRKIAAPAFSERNNRMVWEETVLIMEDLFTEIWGDKKVIEVDHAVDLTLPIALFVLGAAGFGKRVSWKDKEVAAQGHTLAFKEALHCVSADAFIKWAAPDWAMGMTQRMRDVQIAFDELERYMMEMIQERSASGTAQKNDLFSNLLESNNADEEGDALTARELLGNIFIFLIAGHETTAHALAFSFALLALYQDEQEKVYQQVKSVSPNGEIPTYDDRNKLDRCLAAYYETLRLIPPVTNIPKVAAQDTSLTIHNAQGEKVAMPVQAGVQIALNIAGLHHNPRYWENPDDFNPDRFLKDYNRDAFLPFSGGARSCIGRTFFETEAVIGLAMLLSRYKITIKEEAEFAHETFEETKARVLSSKAGLTVTPLRIPLVFTRRD